MRRGRKCLQHLRPLTEMHLLKEAHMAVNANIGLRGDSASTDTPDNWKPIGLLALAHVKRVLEDAPKAEVRK